MILQAAILMGALGLLFAIFLGFANRKFHVDTNPKIEQVEAVLPGVNCGGCGYPSCAAYAEAIAENGEAVDLCVVGGEETTRAVAEVMGVDVANEDKQKLVAVVFCQGTSEAAAFPGEYRGIPDCAAAMYSQDVAKRCKYGCIGLGSCVRACPFDAIHLSEGGVPYVDAVKCTACGKCVEACPRDLIELHSVDHEAFVFCKSQDAGPIAKKVCKKACIACNICVKAAAKDENAEAVQMHGNLAVVNTKPYTAKAEYGEKCPTDAYTTRANIVNYQRYVHAAGGGPDGGSSGGGTREEEPVT
ncbi:MAG: RnfABCDGE type electron transport complex subunit B [Spirochaetes bacterium]|jgi:electron transport complex protein RnfB|nr:RnfABCDGE type electron transport complex subunit B [Spirochaetota bacterium]